MSYLIIGTNTVRLNEPCYLLVEQNLNRDGTWRRWQTIWVIRDDKTVPMMRDMGPKENFTADQFCVVGGGKDYYTGRIWIEHTVAELLEMAEDIRNEPFDKTGLMVTDLGAQFQLEHEKKLKIARKGDYRQYGHGS